MKYLLILIILIITSCAKKTDFISELEDVSFKPVSFLELDGWFEDNCSEIYPAFMNSCEIIFKKAPDSKLDNSLIEQKTSDWHKICNEIKALGADDFNIRRYLEENMKPYAVINNNNGDEKEGMFTGYYEASLNGSYNKNNKYKYPLYAPPNDMISCNPSHFNPSFVNQNLLGKIENKRLIPYLTRKDIEEKGVDAKPILWVDDPVDSFILHIQGSGIARLTDGKRIRVGYAANNGHNFVGIGSIMSREGLLKPNEASMVHIRQWLRENYHQATELMQRNPRYIFFRLYEGEGPIGGLGVPLTTKRSIAVDRRYIPLGVPLWLNTKDPDGNKLNRLMMAQDVGSAIKGSVRGDFFWGYGEEAFYNAGRMKSQGTYYIILPK